MTQSLPLLEASMQHTRLCGGDIRSITEVHSDLVPEGFTPFNYIDSAAIRAL